jgi:predicted DNA-binding ribbon-helix-helix protein
VAGLHGEAGFITASDGVRVRHLRLEAMPLAVPSWGEAARRVEAVKASATATQKLEAPFYGTFHLMADNRHYAVDALTGKVDQDK